MTTPSTSIDLLISAQWILPVEPDGVVLQDHSIAIHHGEITAILPTEQALQHFQPSTHERFNEHVLMPGLINAHTHNPMTLLRGYADDLPLMEWLQQHIWPAEQRAMGIEFIRDGTELAIAEMIRGGTTCCNENYFFPDIIAATYHHYGFRALVGLPFIDFPTAWAQTTTEYFEKAQITYDVFAHNTLVRTTLAPHAPFTVNNDTFQRIHELANKWDVPIHLHLHETQQEITESLSQYGQRPIERLAKLGIIDQRLLAVHMTQLQDDEIALCAEHGVHIVHCPESNLKLASGFCPVARLLETGINVCIGTDGCASNNDLDMLGEMRTTALLAKGVAGDARAVNAATAIRMATYNAAKALGIADITGSLSAGKAADIIAIRLDEIETVPLYHLPSHIVYACQRQQVTDVWIAGNRQLKNHVLCHMDTDKIRSNSACWARKIKS